MSNAPIHRILITGGAGFIGTHLAERLCRDYELVLLDNFRRDSLSLCPHLAANPNIRVISGDILDPSSVKGACEGVDAVLHLAAIAGVSSYYEEPLRTLQVNILGAVNVLEDAIKRPVRLFIYFSTSEVFGPDALWVEEDSPHHIGPVSDPRWVYATSKLAGEQLSLRYAEKHGMGCVVVRPFNIYGPRQIGEGAISNFCRAVAERKPMTVYGDGASIRAWCYVSDLVDAIEAMIHAPATSGQIFNIGNPREVDTALGLARRIVRAVPEAEIQFQDSSHADVRARVPVIDRARRLLGFEPKISLDEGLGRTLQWFMRRGIG